MRIAQIMLGKNFGGAERSFVDMCQALGSKGHDVLAICERRSKAVTFVEQIEGLTSKTVIVRGSWDPFARRKIKRHLEIFDADVVQMHLARSAQMAGPAARLLGIPSVAKTHNYVNLKYYESISKLVPTTRRQEVYLRSQGVPEDRISRIPNFSSIPPKPPKTEPTNWSSGVLQVVGLGRLVHKKGFDLFLRAVAAARRDGLKLAVTIAGAGPESGALMRLRRDLGLEKVVTFLGWQDDVQTYLSKADVFVLPSRDEPFGIVCLEAMASCLPIIATRTHGPTEILNEDTAILVEPGDSTGLTKALQRIAREPRQAAQRAVAAQQHFKQNFSVNAVLSQYLELYKGLTKAEQWL